MTYLVIIIFSLILYQANSRKLIASDFMIRKNCSFVRTFRVQNQITHKDFYLTNNPISQIKINRMQPICCDGYQNYDEQNCIPVCSKSCGTHGICSAPEVCTCEEGYTMGQNLQECKPTCELTCEFGSCIAPNVCPCKEGYRWSQDEEGWSFDEPDCKPICSNCATEETCTEPHTCKCKQGYVREAMNRSEYVNTTKCKSICDEPCVNSECVAPNFCECHENYTRIDAFTCDVRLYVVSDFAVSKKCTETMIIKERETISKEISYYDEHTKRYTSDMDYKVKLVLDNKTVSVCCLGYQNFDEEKCIPVCNKNCGIYGICSAPNVCICNKGFAMDQNFLTCKPI